MSEAYRQATVYVRDRYAGMLQETEEGYSFAYDADYLQTPEALPVSLTLPLSEEAYTCTAAASANRPISKSKSPSW